MVNSFGPLLQDDEDLEFDKFISELEDEDPNADDFARNDLFIANFDENKNITIQQNSDMYFNLHQSEMLIQNTTNKNMHINVLIEQLLKKETSVEMKIIFQNSTHV